MYYYKGIRHSPETEKLTQQTNTSESVTLDDFRSTHAKRAIFIGLSLTIFKVFSGFLIVTSNSTAIFAEAGSHLTPLQSSIIVYAVQASAALTGVLLIDRVGRIPLLFASQFGVAALLAILSVHHLIKDQIPECNWIPFYGVIFAVYAYMLGIILVPSSIIVDISPQKVSVLITNNSSWCKYLQILDTQPYDNFTSINRLA